MNIENLKADALSDSSDNNLEILFLDTFSSSIEDRAFDVSTRACPGYFGISYLPCLFFTIIPTGC